MVYHLSVLGPGGSQSKNQTACLIPASVIQNFCVSVLYLHELLHLNKLLLVLLQDFRLL